MRRLYILLSVTAILILSGFLAKFLISLKPEQKKMPPEETQIFVEAQKVSYTTVKTEITATGRVHSMRQVDLSSEVQGRILETRIPLKKGQVFQKGDLLVNIFMQDALYNLHSRKSRFLNLLANSLPDLKIDFPENYEKWELFFQSISIEKQLPALPEISSTQEKIFVSGRNLLSEYYGIKSDETRLQKYQLYAPFSGSFTDVFLEAGSVANPGSRIAKMIRTDHLEIEVPVEASQARWIHLNDMVHISYNETKTGRGKVIRKSNYVNEATQSVNIYVEVTVSDGLIIYQGEYLKVIFSGMSFSNAMEMPRNAVIDKNTVYIVEKGILKKSIINVLKLNEKTLIFNGLEEGTELVVEPLLNISENTKVSVLR